MTITVCIKWVLPNRDGDERFAGISLADQAALETGLRVAEAMNEACNVITVGPPAAETSLRDALACGAHDAKRIDGGSDLSSSETARLLAAHCANSRLVVCGDYSPDRGSGSVPALIAAHLAAGQALGLIDVTIVGENLSVVRRLDGGRRERLSVGSPAVISVEGSVARLRRAPLRATLAAANAPITVIRPDTTGAIQRSTEPQPLRPYRPRARVVPSPSGASALERVKRITDTSTSKGHGETVHLSPTDAAQRILTSLREWGYFVDESL
ncbi:MAG: putative mycofactocin-associated electron transfer flavoprotein [Actinobacteria bacterium]|nr:putative mycofactocin-associated electron transfer flavoprotein [Actinomycetota bacterium]